MKRNILHIMVIFLLLVFTFGVNSSYGLIKSSYVQIIKIAYMNGFISGMEIDLEQRKKIRVDPSFREKLVKEAAERYVQKVYELNQDK